MTTKTSKTKNKIKTDNVINDGEVVDMQQYATPQTKFAVTDLSDKIQSKALKSVGVYLMHNDVKMPTKASDEASCYDLSVFFNDGDTIKQIGQDNVEIPTKANNGKFVLYPHARALIPTGIKLDIPVGYDVRVYPRSGIPFKDGISVPNSLGVIDSDYRGELFISLINHTDKQYTVKSGTRMAQFEINKLADLNLVVVDKYDKNTTNRSSGGFGSTGE